MKVLCVTWLILPSHSLPLLSYIVLLLLPLTVTSSASFALLVSRKQPFLDLPYLCYAARSDPQTCVAGSTQITPAPSLHGIPALAKNCLTPVDNLKREAPRPGSCCPTCRSSPIMT